MISRLLRAETLVGSLVGVGTVSCTVIVLKNTFLAKYYAKFKSKLGPDSQPIPLDTVMQCKLDECYKALKLTEWNKKFYKPFITSEMDPFQIGNTNFKTGAFIGIPHYYQAFNKEEIIDSNILVDNKPVNWDSADGIQFLQSLELSDRAQKFAIGKEILLSQSYKHIIDALIPTLMVIGCYGTAVKVYQWFQLLHKPLISSIFVFSCVCVFFVFLYIFIDDGVSLQYDKNAEEQLYQISKNYIQGGIEYYSKKLERNKALRNLEKNGTNKYSVTGNETSILRTKGLPLTYKLKLAHEYLRVKYERDEFMKPPPAREGFPIN